MRKFIHLIFLIILALGAKHSLYGQSILDQKISLQLKGVPLEEALYQLMEINEVNLSFSNSLIPEKSVTISVKDQALKIVLETLLRDTKLTFQLIGHQVVLYRQKQLIKPSRYTISGYLKDIDTGEPLIGASIWNTFDGKGTTTNPYGFFSLTLDSGPVDVRFSYIGYQSQSLNKRLTENLFITKYLKQTVTLSEVLIVANDSTLEQRPGMSVNEISADDIEALPALAGEPDLARTITLLPGVVTGTDGLGGIMVRGGNTGQNLILIDGVPVYDFGHAGGIFSIFNPLAIKSAKLIKGGFPARYNGRLSSVLDVRLKEGNKKQFSGRIDLSLLSGRISLEGPIKKNQSSFIISGRFSYFDLLLKPISEQYKANRNIGGSVDYLFNDLNFKVTHEFSDKHKLFFSYYDGVDNYENSGDFTALLSYPSQNDYVQRHEMSSESWNWGNRVSSLRWNAVLGDKLFSNVALTYSNFGVDFQSIETDKVVHVFRDTTLFNHFVYNKFESSITDIGARVDFNFIPNPQHNIRMGWSWVNHDFSPGVLSIEDESLRSGVAFSNDNILASEMTAYFEDELTLSDNWVINAGLTFVDWEVNQVHQRSWQPRLSSYWKLGSSIGAKVSYSKMAQFVHRLSNGQIGLPTDLWVLTTEDLLPEQSHQFGAGFDLFFNAEYDLSVEGYFKKMTDLLSYSEGASVLTNWEDNITVGNGRAYGAEFQLRKKAGKLTGWLSYAWANTDRQFEKVNFGERFPFQFDRRHDFKAVAKYRLSDRWHIGATWTYNTGTATSLPLENYFVVVPSTNNSGSKVTGVYASEFEGKNQFRMPDYHRLDVNVQVLLGGPRLNHIFSGGVYNLYDRRNPLYYRFRQEFSYERGYLEIAKKEYVQAWLIPFLPYISYSFRF